MRRSENWTFIGWSLTLVTATVLRTRTRSARGIKRLRDDWKGTKTMRVKTTGIWRSEVINCNNHGRSRSVYSMRSYRHTITYHFCTNECELRAVYSRLPGTKKFSRMGKDRTRALLTLHLHPKKITWRRVLWFQLSLDISIHRTDFYTS